MAKKEKVINLYFIYGANLLALFLLSASRLLIHFFKHKNHPILEWCVSAHCFKNGNEKKPKENLKGALTHQIN
ncbi:hypothetical protein HQ697_13855 [Enterococcus faecium]|uniref:hypothetical protein n=1 Tax=Lactococcus TaxID=1357 RepID=UPI001574CAD2|nr:hypothetical protein [Lactococcus lactis]MBS7194627.1 hypothetical protein [Clostridiales bacterium]MDA2898162.1 hypothetical protein [Lactococcus lactis]NTM25641.1 hypothetical protein [Enterococcus faecium]